MLAALRSIFRGFRDDQRGSVLVEMTLITPLMISLSAGVFEFGNLIHQKLLIEAGLRDGARYAARCRPGFSSLSGLTCEQVAANIAATGAANSGGTPRVTGWVADDVNVNRSHLSIAVTLDEDGNQNYHSSAEFVLVVRVDTEFEFEGTSLLAYLGLGPITLTGSHEERVIGW
jgi:Flp pilus assembly protein TadG